MEAVHGEDIQLQLLATQATRYTPGTRGQKAASSCLRSCLERWQREKEPGNPNCPWQSLLVPVCYAWLTVLCEPNQGLAELPLPVLCQELCWIPQKIECQVLGQD